MSHKTVDCPVEVNDPYGSFANAFRITIDGSEVLLDFCLYSSELNRAKVVARVRIATGFLGTIHNRIGNSLNRKNNSGLFVFPEIKGLN